MFNLWYTDAFSPITSMAQWIGQLELHFSLLRKGYKSFGWRKPPAGLNAHLQEHMEVPFIFF